MRNDWKSLVTFLSIACVPPWIGWSLLRFGVVPADGAWQSLYITGWAASGAGLIATYVDEGGSGVRRLLREAVRVAVPIRWWVLALLAPFAAIACGALFYGAVSGKIVSFAPSAYLALLAPSALVTFFLGPFGEEFGWRGYLLPRFARRFPVLGAVLLVGAVWAIWHWPLLYHGFVAAPGRELAATAVGVTYMSVVIGTVYLRTRSLFLAMFSHWYINGMREIAASLFPGLPDGGDPLLQWCGVGANALVAMAVLPVLLRAGKAGRPGAVSAADHSNVRERPTLT